MHCCNACWSNCKLFYSQVSVHFAIPCLSTNVITAGFWGIIAAPIPFLFSIVYLKLFSDSTSETFPAMAARKSLAPRAVSLQFNFALLRRDDRSVYSALSLFLSRFAKRKCFVSCVRFENCASMPHQWLVCLLVLECVLCV